jgi:hypothetical protein
LPLWAGTLRKMSGMTTVARLRDAATKLAR